MDVKEPAVLPTAEGSPLVQQQQPLLEGSKQNYESVGGGAAMTTDADAPPGYSEVLKEQHPVPQGAFIQLQPVQYMGPDAMDNGKYRSSHDYLIFSAITSVVCGIFSILTLSCSIPAVVLAYQSKKNHLRGSHQTANEYSNCALALTVATIVSGLMGLILGLGIAFALAYQPCKFGLILTICNQ